LATDLGKKYTSLSQHAFLKEINNDSRFTKSVSRYWSLIDMKDGDFPASESDVKWLLEVVGKFLSARKSSWTYAPLLKLPRIFLRFVEDIDGFHIWYLWCSVRNFQSFHLKRW
jgi:hypothetical protein